MADADSDVFRLGAPALQGCYATVGISIRGVLRASAAAGVIEWVVYIR